MRIDGGPQGGQFAFVASPEHVGDSVTVAITQPPTSEAKWRIRLLARLDEGIFFVTQWKTLEPNTQGFASSYILGGATVAGARGWICNVKRVDETGDNDSWVDVVLTSSRAGQAPAVTTLPTFLPTDEP